MVKEKKSFAYWLWVSFWTILAPTLLAIFLDATGRLDRLYAWYAGVRDLPVVNEMKNDFLTGAKLYGQEYGPKVQAFYASLSSSVVKSLSSSRSRKSGPRYWDREKVAGQLISVLPRRKRGNMDAYLDYIEEFRQLAVDEMRRTGIPASVTLAQGLLESDANRSRLARVAKNHFGIKCRARKGFKNDGIIDDEDFKPHSMCTGCLQANDDNVWDRFEMYEEVSDSYRRHSILLQQARYRWMIPRYRVGEMYEIPRLLYGRDFVPYYAAWAVGLKSSGYATSGSYPEKIALIIEYYQLPLIDYEGMEQA